MNRVPTQDVKKRTKVLSEVFASYRPYDHKVGWRQSVLVTEVSHDGQYYVAHNKSYDQVLVPKDANLLGRMVEVDIVSTGKHYLMADLFKTGAVQRPVSVPPPLQHGQVSGVPAAQTSKDVLTESTLHGKKEDKGHPVWVQMTAIVVGLALIVRMAMFAFYNA
ncbi:Threonylcarbamoyladenosine tRNA methylthiotransferase [Lamellibrachia satsuma]|nr:Threonylcarbamoyladenosine tRNA methylthiotransferase [Lamellibrachia satsuma]